MTPKDVLQWLTIAGMLLSGGIWLGHLQDQVNGNRKDFNFINGDIHAPATKE